METYAAMRTTFAARDFTADPVPDEVVHRILDNARFAPSGGNRQGWHVIVVRDEAKRASLVPLIEPTYRRYLAEAKAGANPWNTIEPAQIDQATVRVPWSGSGYAGCCRRQRPDWKITFPSEASKPGMPARSSASSPCSGWCASAITRWNKRTPRSSAGRTQSTSPWRSSESSAMWASGQPCWQCC